MASSPGDSVVHYATRIYHFRSMLLAIDAFHLSIL
jgi:hypothetical protein